MIESDDMDVPIDSSTMQSVHIAEDVTKTGTEVSGGDTEEWVTAENSADCESVENSEPIPKWKMWMMAASESIQKNETVQKIVKVTNENIVDPVLENETVQKFVKATNENIVDPVKEKTAPVWEAAKEKSAPVWQATKEKASEGAAIAKEISESAFEKSKEVMHEASERAGPAMRRASDSAASMWSNTVRVASEAATAASHAVNERTHRRSDASSDSDMPSTVFDSVPDSRSDQIPPISGDAKSEETSI